MVVCLHRNMYPKWFLQQFLRLRKGAFVCVPITPTRAPDVSVSKGTSSNSAKAAILKNEEGIIEKEQAENIIHVKEGQELLKFIKQSDFKIADQLGQTPSKISILTLLLGQKLIERIF